MHRRRGHGDVAHLAPRAGVTFAVEVDSGVWYRERILGHFEVGVGLRPAQDVQHDGGFADGEAAGRDGQVEDCP